MIRKTDHRPLYFGLGILGLLISTCCFLGVKAIHPWNIIFFVSAAPIFMLSLYCVIAIHYDTERENERLRKLLFLK